jgi:coenzyme F420 hydrogenase subunit beta
MVSRGRGLSSQDLLQKSVLETGLCTGCGACVGLCPYQVIYHDRTVHLHRCDLDDGQCYAFCPRSDINLTAIRNGLFDLSDLTSEIGAVKGYYLSRATDSALRAISQHGGTVTALMELALTSGLIDCAVVSSRNHDIEQKGIKVKDTMALRRNAGSSFTVSPIVAAFNQIVAEETGGIGVVTAPCQALALAKMKLMPHKDSAGGMDKLKLVIGLYCGWSLSAEKFRVLLAKNNLGADELIGMDIPAGKKALELRTGNGVKLIPLDNVQDCVREACGYCFDSTAEFADISVGSSRWGNNWEEMRGWNQLIVRTAQGMRLIDLAVKHGVLEIKQAPAESLKELKMAAARKKKAALKNIIKKSGSAKNLLYLNSSDPLVKEFLGKMKR